MSFSSSGPSAPPTFDARLFEPPAWATDDFHTSRMDSAAGPSSSAKNAPVVNKSDVKDDTWEDEDEKGPPSSGELGVEFDSNDAVQFTTSELQNLLAQGARLKDEGNKRFTAKHQQLDEARDSYLSALDKLPLLPPPSKAAIPAASGIQEVTDEEAEAIEAESHDQERQQRVAVENQIRECSKAVWGNLGAVYLVMEESKEAVDACTKALELDPTYTKALQRRATANERIGSWSALTAAREDYDRLLTLLPKGSAQLASVRQALVSLPQRITAQQEKEKDEMMSKLKELGNGILGKFGLSTDMFHFDQQPSGGYNLRFQK